MFAAAVTRPTRNFCENLQKTIEDLLKNFCFFRCNNILYLSTKKSSFVPFNVIEMV